MRQAHRDLLLMPWPLEIERRDGVAVAVHGPVAATYTGVRTERLARAVARLDGAAPPAVTPPLPLIVDCAAAGGEHPALDDDESYVLSVSPAGVRIEAPAEWGVLRGLATLTQLRAGAAVAPLRIVDRPRFPWRGLMLDVARHFLPADVLLGTLDAMAVFKLNVLHLHLSDDQAFRFPSRRHPRLASADHYTAAELDAVVAAAADRGIRVVPELDVPGHVTSWLEAHPEWGNRPVAPSRRFGVHQACLDVTRIEVVRAVESLFAELAETFPDRYLHMGGDEVHPAWWSEDPGVAAFMASRGLEDTAALQASFHAGLTRCLEALGRRAMGWDEILHPATPAAVTVQAWRGATARDRALSAGHDCVVSAPYYLDLFYPADVHYGFDPAAPQAELTAREDALLEDPRFSHVAGGMRWTHQWRTDAQLHPADGGGRLLGAEACLWAELVDARVLGVRLWSRMPAVAERFWSPADCNDVDDMYRRLDAMLDGLPSWAGIDVAADYRRMTQEAGVSDRWRPLVDLLEPIKWYGRLLGEQALAARLRGREMPKSRPYDADTPLHRVVDALPPESAAARRLAGLTRAEIADDPEAGPALRSMAAVWRSLPPGGGPEELEEAAERLRALGALVPAVLDGSLAADRAAAALSLAVEPMGEYVLAAALVLADWVGRRGDRDDGSD